MRNILLAFLLSWVICDTFGQVQYLGSPTTTVRNRGNFVSDSLFYLPKRQKLPSDTGAIRYAISDSSVYVWTGYQWNKLSPGSFVAIGDTASMLNPYVRGSGTVNYLPKFTGTRTFGNSAIIDNGTNVEVGSSASPRKLGVNRTPLYALDVQEVDSTNDQLFEVVRFRKNNNTAGSNQVTFGVRLKSSTSTPTNSMAQIQVGDQSAYRNLSLQVDKFLINDTTSVGSYALQVNGSIYNTTGAVFATTSGNVGIGTNSPSEILHVQKNQNATTRFLFENTDATNTSSRSAIKVKSSTVEGDIISITNLGTYIGTASNHDLYLMRNSSASLKIQSGGEVNIDPAGNFVDAGAYNLQVAGSIYNTTGAVFAASSGDVGIGTTSPSTYSSAKFAVVKTSGTTVAAIVSTDATAGAGFYVQGSDASNNWFQIRQYSASASGTTFGLNNAGSLQFFTSSSSTGALIINQQAAQPFVFATNNTERMRITTAGELLIGTTTDAGAYALQVAGSIYNTTGAVLAASSGNVGINTTSASQKLQVKGSILADSSITATGDLKVLQGVTTGFFNNEGLLASHNGSLRVQMRYLAREHLFSSGQVEAAAIFVDSTANVGIGTSSPTSKLFVSGGDFNVSGGSIIASTPATANNTTKNMLALLAGTDATNGPTAFYIDLRHSTTGTNRRVDIYSADNTNYRNISFPYAKLLVGSTNDAGAYALQVTGAIYNTTTLTTGAPTSGSAKPWRLGEAATVSPTSPNRTIRVEIDGTVYYIHAKTTND